MAEQNDRGFSLDIESRFRITHDNEEVILMTRDENDRKESPLLRLTPTAAQRMAEQLIICADNVNFIQKDWRCPR